MTLAVSRIGTGLFGLVLLIIFYGLPIWAIVSVIRFLRGSLRVIWVVSLLAATFFIPLIGLILSVCWFTFKSRFVDAQRP